MLAFSQTPAKESIDLVRMSSNRIIMERNKTKENHFTSIFYLYKRALKFSTCLKGKGALLTFIYPSHSPSTYPFTSTSTHSVNHPSVYPLCNYPPSSIYLCPSILQSIHPTTILSINTFPIYLFVHPSIHSFICLPTSTHLSMYLSIHLLIHPSIYSEIFLSTRCRIGLYMITKISTVTIEGKIWQGLSYEQSIQGTLIMKQLVFYGKEKEKDNEALILHLNDMQILKVEIKWVKLGPLEDIRFQKFSQFSERSHVLPSSMNHKFPIGLSYFELPYYRSC